MVDDHTVDLPPARHMLVVRNDDRPGMISTVAGALGDVDINIANIHVGQSPSGASALQVLATSQPVPADVVERLAAGRRHRVGPRRRALLTHAPACRWDTTGGGRSGGSVGPGQPLVNALTCVNTPNDPFA